MGSISFAALGNAFRVAEIRKKMLFTLFMLALYRVGSFIPVPGLNSESISDFFSGQGGVFGLLDLWTGGGLSNAAIFGLGVMPYITASIIMQLMTVVVPSLQQMQKEGEVGYRRINQYTRRMTVVLAAMQAAAYYLLFRSQRALPPEVLDMGLLSLGGASRLMLVVLGMTAGTVLLMWMGELITQRGIGNGISLLIFASIVAGVGPGLQSWLSLNDPVKTIVLPLIVVGVTAAVVFMQEGQRKIPVQYAKRQIGRKMTQGQSTYLPLRVNMAGVIPIIFATALMAFPATVAQYAPDTDIGNVIRDIGTALSPTNTAGVLLEAGLVVMFTFFYTMVQFNPVDQADNLKKYGGFIPGVRPGAPTAQYLSRVLTRLTLPGSLYLAALVVLPYAIIRLLDFPGSVYGALGGTTILIVVGVALDSMRQMESQLVMRNYEGFLK